MNAETMTDKPAPVEVTQADKDASADLAHAIGMTCEEFTGGGADILVQAFARHRLTAWNARTQAELVEALRDVRETLALVAKPAHLDPDKHFTSQVQGLGDAFGYGALMACASALWRQSLGDLAGGEFAAGPCVLTVQKQIERLDAAITRATGAAS